MIEELVSSMPVRIIGLIVIAASFIFLIMNPKKTLMMHLMSGKPKPDETGVSPSKAPEPEPAITNSPNEPRS